MNEIESLETIDDQDFSEEIPKTEGSVIWHLMSQLRIGMSLSRITLPTFILETRSTIERFTDWMSHADILRKVQYEPDPLIRCLHLCTWIVSGFHVAPRTPKKPYNSLLGEVYRAIVKDSNGKPFGTYIAEQVSHHPPISAFYYCDHEGSAVIWGHSEMKSKFLGNSVVAQMDDCTKVNFEVPNLGESYEFNFPNMYGRGIIIGKLVMEIAGTVNIKCLKTGVTAKIEFLEKPLIFGRYNRFRGEIYDSNASKKAQIVFDGRWSAFMRVTDKRNDDPPYLSFDVRTQIPLKFDVPSFDELSMYESPRVWREVTKYIKNNDMVHATDHKFALEEKQRLERKYFDDNHIEWKSQSFYFSDELQRYVPYNLNLNPSINKTENEPVTMPPPFKVPEAIQAAIDAGVSKTIDEIQEEVEEKIMGSLNS